MWSRYSVFRVLLPLVAGVLLSESASGMAAWLPPLLVAVAAVALMALLRRGRTTPSRALALQPWRTLPVVLLALAAGWTIAVAHRPPRLPLDAVNGHPVVARVEQVKFTARSTSMQVLLLECHGPDTTPCNTPPALVELTTRGCDYSLVAGDLLAFTAALQPVRNAGNPDEMDRAAFQRHRGILYCQHLPLSAIKRVGHRPTWLNRCANARTWLEGVVLDSRLSVPAQQFVIAALLGNDDMMDPEVRQQFSDAGVAHVLALSGLHVGIIALLVWLLLFPLDRWRLKKLRMGLTLLALVAFAALTGLAPSVVRATVMAGLVMTSVLVQRRAVPLNSLGVAALLIVAFSPSSVYQVGFQLSFITVAAMLLFSPRFMAHAPRGRVWRWLYSTALVSAIATASTLILTAYYFHTITLGGVVANVLVLPFFPVLLLAAALFLLAAACGVELTWLAAVVDFLYDVLARVVDALAGVTVFHVSHVFVTGFDVWCYYAVLALLVLWLVRRSARWLLAAGAAAAVWAVVALAMRAAVPATGFVLVNSFDSSPVFYYEHGRGYLWVPGDDDRARVDDFKRHHEAFLARRGIDSVTLVPDTASLRLQGAFFDRRAALLMGESLLVAGQGQWKRSERVGETRVKWLLVNRHFHSDVAHLQRLYHFDTLVLGGDIYDENLPALEQRCRELGLRPHVMARDGAISRP